MSQTGGPYDFVYVHTDIPAGMTIGEWRTRRAAERIAVKTAAHQERRRRRAAAIRRSLTAPPVAVSRPWLRSREANG
jgi:hypothetical protein